MEDLLAYGYLGLFLSGFVAGSILPFSSEAVLSGALALGWALWPCIIFSFIGNWLGGCTTYYIGYLGKMEWIEKYLRIKHEKVEKMKHFLNGKGEWLAVFAFLPIVGNVLAVTYGLSRTTFWKIAMFMFIGRLFRYVLWAYITVGALSLF